METNKTNYQPRILPVEEADIAPGSLIIDGNRKFQIGELIAEGGMGSIYQAHDTNCHRTVAMKVLHASSNHTSEELLRFVEEAQITSQLEHPNIIPIHEVGIDGEARVYFTMKHVVGKTLTDVLIGLRRNDPEIVNEFPLSRLINILQKVCDAVAFAHARKVLHRDLKPDNIMIAEYGEVLVVDWGLAKLATSESAPYNPSEQDELCELEEDVIHSLRQEDIGSGLRTMNGYIMGTPGFMAPEHVSANCDKLSPLSDIYSLGAILYSILTLHPPIRPTQYETSKELIQALHANEIRPPIDYNKRAECSDDRETYIFAHCPDGNVPEPLSRIAMRALSTNPEDRYESVIKLQEDLEAFQTGTMWHLVADHDMNNPTNLTHWDIYGGKHEIAEGALRISGGEPQVLLFRQELPGDIRIEYECCIQSIYLNNLGCFIAAISAGDKNTLPYSGYEFCYGAYDNSLNLLSRADEKIWTQTASPLQRETTYHIAAERSGNTLTLTVNGERIFSVVDPDPLSGANRTAVGLYGWLSDVRYKRIKIYTRGAPWMADILDIAERQLQKGNYEVAKTLYRDILASYPSGLRFKRASTGIERAFKREAMDEQLKLWRHKLETAWPEANIKISMVNEKLTVEIVKCGISNLEPLAELPLTALYCHNNQITSLEPLRGMDLEMLNCSGNPVVSLEPLRGMPLKTLACEGAAINDLSPLKGMPLTQLNCGGCHHITSLDALRGMQIGFLSCWGNEIESLQPLEGMQLTGLFCGGNRIADLTPLRHMPIKILHCSGNCIESLAPLANLQLSRLHCAGNRIEDLTPLSDMPLTMLSCQTNRIQSLAPLKGDDLGTLTCGSNLLADIEPFSDCPPQDFIFTCDSMKLDVLKNIQAKWASRDDLQHHRRNLDTIIALRENDINRLYDLAHEYKNALYLFIPVFQTWHLADEFCKTLGGNLLSVSSAEENEFITRMFPKGCWFWMGLYKEDDQLIWSDGSPYIYDNFNEPLQRNKPGPKIFNGNWGNEDTPNAENCFMIKWDKTFR